MLKRYTKILVIGIISVWTIAEAGTWEDKASMPTARRAPAGVEVDGKIYVIGGCGGPMKNEKYDPATDSWSTKANMPQRRGMGPVACEADGKIYVIGGRRQTGPVNFNEEYNPATNLWATKTPIPTARNGACAGVVDGKIYVIGGHSGTSPLSTVQEYNPAEDSWSTMSPMPTARAYLAGAVVDEKIYIIGGHDGTNCLNTVEEYDPSTDSWTNRTPMPTARFWLAAAAVGEKIYAIGGFDGTNWLNTVEVYDPVEDSWSTEISMPTERSHLTAIETDGKIYTMGGVIAGGDFTGVNEEFTPEVGIEEEQTLPETYYLADNYPNPFSHETAINYHIFRDGYVTLRIHNILGQEILTLVDAYQKASSYTVHWNGKDESDNEVKSGVYFYRIETENYTMTKRMIVIK